MGLVCERIYATQMAVFDIKGVFLREWNCLLRVAYPYQGELSAENHGEELPRRVLQQHPIARPLA